MEIMPVASFGGEMGFIALIVLPTTIFWVVMLVDAARREFTDSNMKLVWILVLVFTHLLGALIYCFVGRPMGRLR